MFDAVACCYNPKGSDIVFPASSIKSISCVPRQRSQNLDVSCSCSHLAHKPLFSIDHRINYNLLYKKHNVFKNSPLSSVGCGEGFCFPIYRHIKKVKVRIHSSLDVANAVDVINDLGLDTLTFLAVTVLVVPAFKKIKASPILGFFFAGIVLNQLGLIRNLIDVKILSEWGILFLLFEMGLELSLDRLRALAKFAFGLGLTQVLLSTLAFTAFELPPNGAVGTRILEFLFHSRPDLVNIRSVDEAVVIGAALSLSSSAFVLQLLAEKGELPTKFGSATLGILLLQDIAVVPLLVVLPVLESQNFAQESIWPMLAEASLKALGGLGLLSLGGKYFLRRVFEVVADTRSSEAFVALCLLTVSGTSLITQKLGFSDMLLIREWPNVFSLLAGLITIKTLIITAIGPRVGLTLQESVRIGLLLSQGGEFGFVVFSLANRLGVLPLELNKLLIIVVVLSMALTPLLNEVGRKAADFIGEKFENESKTDDSVNFNASEPIVIVGFGQKAQVLANFLSTPLASGIDGEAGWPYVAFDLDPSVVKASRKLGFPVLYGDGSRPAVLQSAGIGSPKAVMVMYTGKKKTSEAVQRIRLAFPGVPIYAWARDMMHLLDLKKAGATDAILENAESSLQLGSKLLKGLGVMSDDVSFLSQLVRDSMELQAQDALERTDDPKVNVMKSLQVRAVDSLGAPPYSNEDEARRIKRANEDITLDSPTTTNPSYNSELELNDEEAKGLLYCEIDSENDTQSQFDGVYMKNPVGVTNEDT